jgi:two-component system chemotaxis response regulator CheB
MGHGLNELLQKKSVLKVVEVEHSQPIEPSRIYLAPADYHLLVEEGHFSLSVDEKVHYSRPSIDVLFETAADVYKDRCIGILLTGANADGAQGLKRIKEMGGHTIVQDPQTAERHEMPQAALDIGAQTRVMNLTQIANYLARLNRGDDERQD